MTWLRWLGLVEVAGGGIALAIGMTLWQSTEVQLRAEYYGVFNTSAGWLTLIGICGIVAGTAAVAFGGKKLGGKNSPRPVEQPEE